MVLLSQVAEQLWGDSLFLTTKSPGKPGIHLINLGRMKGGVDLGTTHWFRTWDSWYGNSAPKQLGHGAINTLLELNSIYSPVTTFLQFALLWGFNNVWLGSWIF